MNLELLGFSGLEFPEIVESYLEDGFAITCAFNRYGTLLASGCNDGRIIIWDFDTRSVSRYLVGHVHPVTSVSWSRDSRFLLSSSTDTNVILWNTLTAQRLRTFKFPTPVLSCQLHPRNCEVFLCCPMATLPVLVEISTDARLDLPMDSDTDGAASVSTPAAASSSTSTLSASMPAANALHPTAVFSRRGNHVFVGNPKGRLLCVDAKTRQILQSTVVNANAAIKTIHCNKKKDFILVNAADRVIRLLDANTLEVLQKYQENVNRIQWKTCCFSSDAEYVVAAAQNSDHKIFIWERNASGPWTKILEGPKEGILDVTWHPVRPIIASTSSHGRVLIWNITQTENWSAFAPDFVELEENVEYEEREDEFDIVDEEQVKKKKIEDEDVDVDIVTVKKTVYSSDEESTGEDDSLLYLPLLPIVNDATREAIASARAEVDSASDAKPVKSESDSHERDTDESVYQDASTDAPSKRTAETAGLDASEPSVKRARTDENGSEENVQV